MRFKNILKKNWIFFIVFFTSNYYFWCFLYFFCNFIFKYIEMGSDCAAIPNENILSWVLHNRTHSSCVLPQKNPNSFRSSCRWIHQPWVLSWVDPSALALTTSRTHQPWLLLRASPIIVGPIFSRTHQCWVLPLPWPINIHGWWIFINIIKFIINIIIV